MNMNMNIDLNKLFIVEAILLVLLSVNRLFKIVKVNMIVELLLLVSLVLTIYSMNSVENFAVFRPENVVSNYFNSDFSEGLLCPEDNNYVGWNNRRYNKDKQNFVSNENTGCGKDMDNDFVNVGPGESKCYKQIESNEPLFDEFHINLPNSSHMSKYLGVDKNQNAPSVNCDESDPRKSMFMFSHNQCKPSCCMNSPYSCSGGCVCLTDKQRKCIGNRQ